MRGEYLPGGREWLEEEELPPRARRIPAWRVSHWTPSGTTSACAENTGHARPGGYAPGNYLRVRGEYFPFKVETNILTELPPRARRIRGEVLRKRGDV